MPILERPKLACSKILLVEDDPLILMVLADSLREAGLTIVAAESADEAVAILVGSAGAFDAVVSDIEMPGSLDGVALSQLVSEAWPEIVMILTSGRVRPAKCDMPAAVKFVSKPYDVNHLAMMLAQSP